MAVPKVFRTRTSFFLALTCVLLTLGISGYLAVSSPSELTQSIPILLAFGSGAWLVFGRPRLVVGPGDIRVVNILRNITIPWSTYRGVSTSWNLKIDTAQGDVVVWALPISGRLSSRIADGRSSHPAAQAVHALENPNATDPGPATVVTVWDPLAVAQVAAIIILLGIAVL